jgi:hypothetical protein
MKGDIVRVKVRNEIKKYCKEDDGMEEVKVRNEKMIVK